jgi:expansin (peptidoglycan-binding protein)
VRRFGVFACAIASLALVGVACQPVFGSDDPIVTVPVTPGVITVPTPSDSAPASLTTAPSGTGTGIPVQAYPTTVVPTPRSASTNVPTTTKPPNTTQPAPQAPAPATTTVPTGRIMPGVTYQGQATHYGADGGGNCMFDTSSDPNMPFVAMNQADYENSRMCGAYIEVTGPGGKKTVVMVTDRCPECPAGNLDLSHQAFAKLADPVTGMIDVSWRLVSPASIGNVQYRIKDGSSAYWFAIQVRNHRNPIATLEVNVNGSWQALPRYEWNHFVVEPGLGPGPYTVRITDFYGEQLVHTVNLAPATVQTTSSQFSQR